MTYTTTQDAPVMAVAERAPTVRELLNDVDTAISKAGDMAEQVCGFVRNEPRQGLENAPNVCDMTSQLEDIRQKGQYLCELMYQIVRNLGLEG